MTTQQLRIYRYYKEIIQGRLAEAGELCDDELRAMITEVLSQGGDETQADLRLRMLIGKRIFNALRGLDVLQPLVEDEDVTEIMANGPSDIFYEKNGIITRFDESFESRERMEDCILQLVGQMNRTVNEASPIVDARLPDGSRVNAVFRPVAVNGPALTIRRFRKDPIRLEELMAWGTLSAEMADFLREAVERHYNIFVCGGTASGKTTLLNVLSDFIPPSERVITIEDTAELRLRGTENIVSLEARGGMGGAKPISIRELIKTSLRMRPDRIIVGEIRGGEALDMLQAMNSGHDGSLSTGHANSCRDMLSRIETMVLMGADLPLAAVREQIASAIDLMVFIKKTEGGKRVVAEIVQLLGIRDGHIEMETLFNPERCAAKLCRLKQ